MKKTNFLYFLILWMFLPNLVCSQDYEPMAQEQNRWIVNMTDDSSWWIEDLWEYYIDGDTIINEINYFKVYRRDLIVTQDGPPYEAESDYQLTALMRDDISAKKVYAIYLENISYSSCPVNEEVLLYDFGLSVGDTAVSCIIPTFIDFEINSINSNFRYGYPTRDFVHGGPYEYFEGIGSPFGLFENLFFPVKGNESRLPMTSLMYFCRQDSCSLVVSVDEPDYNKSIRISPNPADEYVNIEAGISGKLACRSHQRYAWQ
ncbi:MAG: hypothetical protein U5L09_15505 [Bacteroidales bacterium]|nr:hypothetical protein [Bacteroidales bacterium]